MNNTLDELFAQNFTYSQQTHGVIVEHLRANADYTIQYLIENFAKIQFAIADPLYSKRFFIRTLFEAANTSSAVTGLLALDPNNIISLTYHEKEKLNLIQVNDLQVLLKVILPLAEHPGSSLTTHDILTFAATGEKLQLIFHEISVLDEQRKLILFPKCITWLINHQEPEFALVLETWAGYLLYYTDVFDSRIVLWLLTYIKDSAVFEILNTQPPGWKDKTLNVQVIEALFKSIKSEDTPKLVSTLLDLCNISIIQDLLTVLHTGQVLNTEVIGLFFQHGKYVQEVVEFCEKNSVTIPKEVYVTVTVDQLIHLFKISMPRGLKFLHHLAQYDPQYTNKVLSVLNIPEVAGDSYYVKEILATIQAPTDNDQAQKYLAYFIDNPTIHIPPEWAVIFRFVRDRSLISKLLSSRIHTFLSKENVQFYEQAAKTNVLFAKELWKYVKAWSKEHKISSEDSTHLRRVLFKVVPFPQKLFLW